MQWQTHKQHAEQTEIKTPVKESWQEPLHSVEFPYFIYLFILERNPQMSWVWGL